RAARQAHGPRRCDHLRRQGHRRGKARRHGGIRDQGHAQSRGDGQAPQIGAALARRPMAQAAAGEPAMPDMMEALADSQFWVGLAEIVGVNIVLSGDNAVVIALAARSLPKAQQKKAIVVGSAAAIVLRILLTAVAAKALALPWLKLLGSLLLLWI